MFSIFKKASDEQEVVLQDLTEEQLAQAAGGRDFDWNRSNDHDWDDRKKWIKHHHHHHHHHHDEWNNHTTWSNSNTNSNSTSGYITSGSMHW